MTDSRSKSADPKAVGRKAAEAPRPVPSGRAARGRLTPPPSKSLTHRFYTLALLADRRRTISRPLDADDTRLYLGALERLGWQVERRPGSVTLTPPDPEAAPAEAEIDCGNAGTMLRFLLAALATMPGRWRLDGVPRLRQRPVGPLAAALAKLGAEIEWGGRRGYPPLTVAAGGLRGGRVRLDAGESSQYLSALLMAAQAASGTVEIEVEALASAPYVDLTLAALGRFGGRVERPAPDRFRVLPSRFLGATRVRVEGDWSAGCYPAAAAALTGGRVTLDGVERDSAQGDRGFLDLLAKMGARVRWQPGTVTVEGTGTLAAVDADLGSMPDQAPTLAAIAPFARGTTRIRGVAHLRIKESDRIAAMVAELRRLGARAEERADGMAIRGTWASREPPAEPVTVDPHDDHRVAMSLALTGLRRPGVSVARPGVVAKSYPGFWHDLERLVV